MMQPHNDPVDAGSQKKLPSILTCLLQTVAVIMVVLGLCALIFSLRTAVIVASSLVLCCLIFATALFLMGLRNAYRSSSAALMNLPSGYHPVSCEITSDFAEMDLTQFYAVDADYQRLGFRPLIDTCENYADGSKADGFQRIYAHSERLCFGWVSFGKPVNQPYQCWHGVATMFADGWKLSSMTNPPLSLLYGIDLPRILVCYNPNMTPDELFAHHCQACECLEQQANLSPVADLSFAFYQVETNKSVAGRHTRIQQKGDIRLFLTALVRRRHLPSVWLGELRGKVRWPTE